VAAGLARRLASLVYEGLIATAIVLIAGFALTPVMSPFADPGGSLVLPGYTRRVAGFALIVAILGAYFVACWSGGRRTLPMKTWRIALVVADGTPVTVPRAIARYAAAWLGPLAALATYAATQSKLAALALALPYGWALLDRERRFLHDRIAGTQLVSSQDIVDR
jgi:uncharacterized RDD family membrane protein YckC